MRGADRARRCWRASLPLVVYQGPGGRHRFNSDRHHTFILEGAREIRAELAADGLTHAFWLGDQRMQPSPLTALAAEAALVVTEDFPAPPFPRWTERLAERAQVPIWLVDTACVVPMRQVGRAHDRAYAFRDAIGDGLGERGFDHGAQFFTVRDPRFARWVDYWLEDGLVAPWFGKLAVMRPGALTPKEDDTRRLVAVPGMNALGRHLAADLDLTCNTRVAQVRREGAHWHLAAEDGREFGPFDALVVAAPAQQSAALLEQGVPAPAAHAARIDMAPCWAVMMTFDGPLQLGFDGAFVQDSALWSGRACEAQQSKPGRGLPHWASCLGPACVYTSFLERSQGCGGRPRAGVRCCTGLPTAAQGKPGPGTSRKAWRREGRGVQGQGRSSKMQPARSVGCPSRTRHQVQG